MIQVTATVLERAFWGEKSQISRRETYSLK